MQFIALCLDIYQIKFFAAGEQLLHHGEGVQPHPGARALTGSTRHDHLTCAPGLLSSYNIFRGERMAGTAVMQPIICQPKVHR